MQGLRIAGGAGRSSMELGWGITMSTHHMSMVVLDHCRLVTVVWRSSLILQVLASYLLLAAPGGDAWSGGSAAAVPALILFGDSTIDVGNNNYLNTFITSDFLPYGRDFDTKSPTGRFTDGRMVADYLAIRLGLPMSLPYLHPNATGDQLLHGINLASSGSGYLPSTSAVANVIPASKQLEMFREYSIKLTHLLGQAKASAMLTDSLYFVSTGSNDYILNYYLNPMLQNQYTTDQFSALILSLQTDFLKQLYHAGARKIGVLGFPPIGCIPGQITLFGGIEQQGCIEEMNAVALAHNKNLKVAIAQAQAIMPGVQLLYLDGYSFLYDAYHNPSKYGLTETRRSCCGEGYISTAGLCNANRAGTCSDASTYMFFDSLHPTQTVYKYVADLFFDSIVTFFNL